MTAQVVELIDVQMYNGQQCLNRYHFVDTTGVADPAVLASDYINDVIPLYANFQPPVVSHLSVITRKVFPTAELQVEHPLGTPVVGGNPSGQVEPSFVAYSVKFSIGATVVLAGGWTGHIKRSGMRTVGVNEGDINGDGVPAAGIVSAVAAFFAELKDPGTDAFLLCVASYLDASRHRQHTVQSYALITGASAPSVSTQNTRKVLRGRTF